MLNIETKEAIRQHFRAWDEDPSNNCGYGQLPSMGADARPRVYKTIHDTQITPIETLNGIGPIDSLYSISWGYTSGVVFVRDSEILWLDNHCTHWEFVKFLNYLKGIHKVGPENLPEIICAAKLNFMFKPHYIRNTSDIPPTPHDPEREKHEYLQTIVASADITVDGDQTNGNFYVWTELFGIVFKVEFSLSNYAFDCTANQIFVDVGKWYVLS